MARQSTLAVSTFEGGMNQDLSKLVSKKNIYYYAKNFRPFTDKEGQGLGGTINVVGNDLDFTIPDTQPVWSFDTTFTDPFPTTVALSITIGATVFPDIFSVVGTTASEIRDSLVEAINATLHYSNNNIYAAAVGTEGVTIYNTGTSIITLATADPNISNLAITILAQTDLEVNMYRHMSREPRKS